ncbi:MAG: dTMP kinase [Rhodospirillales bacterium]|nr:dTMP kinase [Rhodospirillales bacterium]
MTGLFITFEGGEGAGKTTQIKLLAEKLRYNGHEVLTTREPGGTPEAEKIRDLLVQREGGNWDPLSECLLFFTARRMHVETLIKPALAAGKTVISDRFTDSTVAYQGYGHGFDLSLIARVRDLSIGAFQPQLTFLLDLPVEVGLSRSKGRLSASGSAEDKFENLDIDFHQKIRSGFLEISANDPRRCHVIDASESIEAVANNIWNIMR